MYLDRTGWPTAEGDEIIWELTGESWPGSVDKDVTMYNAMLQVSTTSEDLIKLKGKPMPGMPGFTIVGFELFCTRRQNSAISIAVKKETK